LSIRGTRQSLLVSAIFLWQYIDFTFSCLTELQELIFGESMFVARVFAAMILIGDLVACAHATEVPSQDKAGDAKNASLASESKVQILDPDNCFPRYPKASMEANEQGRVRIRFLVGFDDLLISTQIVQSGGYSKLDQATVDALSKCKFKAATKDGKPIESSLTAEYLWKLDPAPPGGQ
jgi:TonB family protein